MKSLVTLVAFGLACGIALGSQSSEDREMKVTVFAQRGEIRNWDSDILEFYDVGPDHFTVAVSAKTYEQMVRLGLEVKVLVWDVVKEASKYDAFFHTYAQLRDTWAIIAQVSRNCA